MGYTDAAAARRQGVMEARSQEKTHRKRRRPGTRGAYPRQHATSSRRREHRRGSRTLSEEYGGMIAAVAEAAVTTSRVSPASGPKAAWRSDDEHAPEISVEAVKSRNALSTAGNDGLRFLPKLGQHRDWPGGAWACRWNFLEAHHE